VFNLQWNGKTLRDLYTYVHQQMPLGNADSLKGQEYADIVAYILAQSGLPSGNEKFTPRSPMDRVLALSDAVTPAASAAAAGASARLGELIGTLKQPTSSKPSQGELDAADSSTTNWLMYNKGYRGARYSLLQRINASNAKNMRQCACSSSVNSVRFLPGRSCMTAFCMPLPISAPTRSTPPHARSCGATSTSPRRRR
jgi:hypothetical protein